MPGKGANVKTIAPFEEEQSLPAEIHGHSGTVLTRGLTKANHLVTL